MNVRPHDGEQPPGQPGDGGTPGGSSPDGCGPACRLNLLLSYAGWQVESWADRLPTLLEPMGIRSHRATNGRQATEVIRAYPIHIAVVDLGLPLERPTPTLARRDPGDEAADESAPWEEGGTRLLEVLSRLTAPPPTVIVKRATTRRDESREIAAALRAGAFAVIDRPREPGDLELLLEVLRRALRRFYHDRWPDIA
ncbi:MAG: hypothetical protein ACKVU4_05210 [Phycisphaerales bacterium]